MKIYNEQNIKKKINEISNSFKLDKIKKYKDKKETIALLILFLRLKFKLDMGEELEYICDGINDNGIDAIYVSDETEEIYFIQSKYRKNEKLKGFENDIKAFNTSVETIISKIKNKDYSKINMHLKNLIINLELERKINDY